MLTIHNDIQAKGLGPIKKVTVMYTNFFLYPKNKTAKNVESKTLACNNFIINTKRKDS